MIGKLPILKSTNINNHTLIGNDTDIAIDTAIFANVKFAKRLFSQTFFSPTLHLIQYIINGWSWDHFLPSTNVSRVMFKLLDLKLPISIILKTGINTYT